MFSQHGEDQIVAAHFGERIGRILDIGAWDPKTFSNSRLLIERGWKAILVEFSPGPVRNLVQAYPSDAQVQIIQAAASIGDNGVLKKFDVTDDGVSTSDPSVRGTWHERGGYYGGLLVPQISLQQIITQFGGGFDFVSIDAEGASVDLAIHWLRDLEQRPEMMCIEHDGRIVELTAVTQACGYRTPVINQTNVLIAREK